MATFPKLESALDDWSFMQKTTGDEGAEIAERFERHFYEFIDEFKEWFNQLQPKPATIDEAENLSEIQKIMELLPGPLELNFLNELELMIEGEEQVRYD